MSGVNPRPGKQTGVSRRSAQATVDKGLAQGPYVAARAGVEPTTLRLRVNAPRSPTNAYCMFPHKIYVFLPFLQNLWITHISAKFTFMGWLYVFCFLLFWPWCIYASCFTCTGRPCLHAVLHAVVFDQRCFKVSLYRSKRRPATCTCRMVIVKFLKPHWRAGAAGHHASVYFTGIQRKVQVCLPEDRRDQSNC